MRFRNSMRLFMENFKQVFRLLVIRFIIALIATAICCSFVLPEFLEIWKSTQLQALLEDFKELLKAVISLKSNELNSIKDAIFGKGGSLNIFVSFLSSKALEITLVFIGCLIVYLLKRFVETICYFTIGSLLNDKMTTYAETSFSTAFISNLGKACAYSAFYVPTVFLFDIFTATICYFLLSALPFVIGIHLSVTLIVLCQSLRLTMTGHWMPAMTADGLKARKAIFTCKKDVRKQTWHAFANYVVTIYLIIIFNVVAAVCTVGSALLITVPASFFILICEQYVNYYTEKGKKYFITYERIATNSDHGDRQHFFDYMVKNEKEELKNTEEEKQEK